MAEKTFYKLAESKVGVTAFSDLHAHIFQEFASVDGQYGSSRFKVLCDTLETVIKSAITRNNILVFAGDLFHKRGAVDTIVMNNIIRIFEKYPEVPTILVRGNHDSKTNSLYSESSLEAFKLMPNVIVVDTPEIVSTSSVDFLCLPYGDEVDEMKEFLSEKLSKLTKPTFVVAHVGIDGASTGKESHRLAGAFGTSDFQADNPLVIAVILGHYHKRQFLGGHKNMFYCGNTIQNTYSDEGQDKGMFHISGFTKGAPIEFEAIDTPKFITVEADKAPDNLEELMTKHYVRFLGSSEEVASVRKVAEELGVTNIRVQEVKDYSDREARLGITPKSTPLEVTSAYAKQHYPEAEDVALACIQEALNNQ